MLGWKEPFANQPVSAEIHMSRFSGVGSLSGVLVAIVGDVILDEFTYGKETRRSAEDSAASCYDVIREEHLPGSAGATARCVALLGGKPTLFSVTGTGRTSKRLSEMLEKLGVNAHFVRDDGRPTTIKQRLVDSETGRQVAVIERQTRDSIPEWAELALIKQVEAVEATVIAVTDNARGVITDKVAPELSRIAREQGKKLLVDARPKPVAWYAEHYPHLYLITPNRREAEVMLGVPIRTQDDIDSAGRRLRDILKCNVLLTLSEQGAQLFPLDGADESFPARNGAPPVSVSGAGDTVVATIALCLGAGVDLKEACRLSQITAAIAVSKEGTGVATKEELAEKLQTHD